MDTRRETRVPILPPRNDYVYCLEESELTFPEEQLETIVRMWNFGEGIEYIAEKFKRNPDEIFLGLFDQARKGKITRAFAPRSNDNNVFVLSLVGGSEYIAEPPMRESGK